MHGKGRQHAGKSCGRAGTYIFTAGYQFPMRGLPVLVPAAVILMLVVSGCTGKLPAPPAESASDFQIEIPPFPMGAQEPAMTTAQAPAWAFRTPPSPSVTTLSDADADQAFADAAEACYNGTPVISNITTHISFVTCMDRTPKPAGACARNYRSNALRYTNDDDTTAGYARETQNTHLARDAYYRNLAYDAPAQQFVPCG
jgi:hypothetical protein